MDKRNRKVMWDTFRTKILKPMYEDRQWCEVCGDTKWLEFHHVEFRSQGGKNDPENVILICKNCHNKAHSDIDFRRYLEGFIKNRIL